MKMKFGFYMNFQALTPLRVDILVMTLLCHKIKTVALDDYCTTP